MSRAAEIDRQMKAMIGASDFTALAHLAAERARLLRRGSDHCRKAHRPRTPREVLS